MLVVLLRLLLAALVLWSAGAMPALAANTPCSGSKGGISHCEGETFVCRDGSASGSRKSCPAYTGQAPRLAQPPPAASDGTGCSCAANAWCTGPRGGTYCLTSSGSKRYLRK